MMQEEGFFFKSGDISLYGFWQGTAEKTKAALLYCHPFGEEKKSAHRPFVEAARNIAAQGVASLRFDMRGCGDSEGDFSEATFSGWLDDIEAAWNELGRRAPDAPRVLLGLRMGAALAALACARIPNVHALILWQPMLNGDEEFTREVRRILVQQMFVTGSAKSGQDDLVTALREGILELDGFPVASSLYEDIAGFEMKNARLKMPSKTVIVQLGRRHRDVDRFISVQALQGGETDVPPIWRRTEFIAGPEAGRILAQDAILPWI